MAIKLQGIEPRPPRPPFPAAPAEMLPADDEGLIKIWRPQAAMRARKGESESTIARFLHSKGVEGAAARAAAKEIVADPGDDETFGQGLTKIVGILLLIVGLMVPVLCFALELSSFATSAALLGCFIGVLVGGRLLWPPADKT